MSNQIWYVVFETGEELDHNVVEMSFHRSEKTAQERAEFHNQKLKEAGMHWDHQANENTFGRIYLYNHNGNTKHYNVDHTGAIVRVCGPFELED
jgi:hypothetical protein